MSRVTRSASRAKASSSKEELDVDLLDPDNDDSEPLQPENDHQEQMASTLQGLLRRALGGAKFIERENEVLRKKVKALQLKLEKVQEADDVTTVQPRRSKRGAADLRKEVQRLKKHALKLEKSKEKYRRKVQELSMREIKTDVDELADAEFEVGDSAYKMRKLLRKFRDLMETNTLGEDEECPICMETLQLKQSQSLPCQHMFCRGCLNQLKAEAGDYDDDVNSIRCPQCRTVCRRDDLETIELTASEQWDALLGVANRWAKMDVRREQDTSEEEAEEEFIVDEDAENNASTIASDGPVAPDPLESSPGPEGQAAEPQTPSRLRRRNAIVTPSPSAEPEEHQQENSEEPVSHEDVSQRGSPLPEASTSSGQITRSYSQSPRKDKRKMLQDMVEARSKKPRL